MKSCTPLYGRAQSRYAICTGFLPVLAVFAFVVLLAFPQIASAQSPFFTELTGGANPLNGLDVNNRSTPVFANFGGDTDFDLMSGRQNTTAVSGQPGRMSMFVYSVRSGTPATPVFTEEADGDNPLFGFTSGTNTAPCAGDFDGDGDTDFIVGLGGSGPTTGQFHYYLNDGDDTTPGFVLFDETDSSNPLLGADVGANAMPTACDMDGDGDLDLFVGTSTGDVRYFKNRRIEDASAEPIFEEQTGNYSGFTNTGNPMDDAVIAGGSAAPCAVDFDKDGDFDLVFGRADGRFVLSINSGTATFPIMDETPSSGTYFPAAIDPGANSTPAFVDMDGDGDLDMISGNSIGRFRYYRNNSCIPVISGCPASLTKDLSVDGIDGVVSLTTTADGDGVTLTAVDGACTVGNVNTVSFLSTSVTLDCADLTFDDEGDPIPVVVHFIARDQYNGCQDTCEILVTLRDVTPPTAICLAAYTVMLDENGEGTLEAIELDNGSTDDCNNDIIDEETNPYGLTFEIEPADILAHDLNEDGVIDFDCNDMGGLITLTMQVTDASGNADQCEVDITVEDSTAPTPDVEELDEIQVSPCMGLTDLASLEAFITANDDEEDPTNDPAAPTAFDAVCDGTLTGDLTSSDPTFNGTVPGTYVVTWTYTDVSGNDTTQTQTVVVLADAPVFATCPDVTVTIHDESCTKTLEVSDFTEPVAMDCEAGSPVTVDGIGFGTIIRSYKFAPAVNATVLTAGTTILATYIARDEDVPFNQSTCNFQIHVVEADVPGNYPTLHQVNTSTGASTQVSGFFGSTYYDLGESECEASITWQHAIRATDNCTMPVSVVVTNDRGVDIVTNTQYVVGSPIETNGGTFPVGTTIVTYTTTDASGLTTTATYMVQVSDHINPVISGCPNGAELVVNTAPGLCTASIAISGMSVSDNCSDYLGIELWVDGDLVGYSYNGDIVPTYDNPLAPRTEIFGASPTPHTVYLSVYNTVYDYHSTTCLYYITVEDHQAPVITCPPNPAPIPVAGACFTTSGQYAWFYPTGTDNCGIIALDETRVSGGVTTGPTAQTPGGMDNTSVFYEGLTTISYIATDDAGNTGTCSFLISVTNTAAPMITNCPDNVTVNNTSGVEGAPGLCSGLLGNYVPDYSTDEIGTDDYAMQCGPGSATISYYLHNSGTEIPDIATYAFPSGTPTTVRFKATDYSQTTRTATCTFIVTVTDTEDPTVSGCPENVTVSADDNCENAYSWTPPTFSDNCPGALTGTTSHTPGFAFPLGTTYVNYDRTDPAGNTVICAFSVTVIDDTAPVLTCPDDMTVNTSTDGTGDCYGTPLFEVTAMENCDDLLDWSYDGVDGVDDQLEVGEYTITYSATDDAGNSGDCAFTVTVVDDEGPSISGCPADIELNILVLNNCALPVTWTHPTAGTDNCGGTPSLTGPVSSPTPGKVPGSSFQTGTTTITYTATDVNGVTSVCEFDITINDLYPPSITCPEDITVIVEAETCNIAVDLGLPTATDNCTAPSSIAFSPMFLDGSLMYTLVVPSTPDGYVIEEDTYVKWTATDASGRTATCYQYVQALPATPSMLCPSDITVNITNNSCVVSKETVFALSADPAYFFPFPTDCYAPVIEGGEENNAPPVFEAGSHIITWAASFVNGESASCDQHVLVIDAINPTITCPPNTTVAANGPNCSAAGVVLNSPVANDNCQGFAVTNDAPTTYPLGTTTVTHTITDAGGRTATCDQTVTVTGGGTPTLTCPANMTVNATSGCSAIVSNLGTPTTVGLGCTGLTQPSPATRNPSGTTFTGVTTVTWTATFSNASTATCAQIVSVLDQTNPTITCPANITTSSNNPNCSASNVVLGAPNAQDNCPGVLATNNALSNYPLGTTTVTHTATDAGGRTATCNQTVTVSGNGTPTITCPTNISVNAQTGCTATVSNLGAPTTNSNPCGNATQTSLTRLPAGSSFTGTTTVTWTATYSNNGTASCLQIVSVNDNTPPSIVCPPDVTVLNDLGDCFAHNVSLGSPNASDNCGSPIVSNNAPSAQDGYEIGGNTVVWTATDGSTNAADCEQSVFVEAREEVCNGLDDDCDGTIDEDVAGGLAELVKALASDGASGDSYGVSVGISGNYAVVGAHMDDDKGSSSGAAYILFYDGSTWVQQKKIVPADGAAGDLFGESVAIDGDLVIIGAREDDDRGTNSGSAYIFGRNMGGTNNWGLVKKLIASIDGAAYDRFGMSVDIHNGYAAVGAPQDDNGATGNQGSVYIFGQNTGGLDNWGQLQKRLAVDGTFFDEFGNSVSLGSTGGRTYLIVGAPKDDEAGVNSNSGAAFIFRDNMGGTDGWNQIKKLVPTDAQADDNFGYSVAISGQNALVGTYLEDNSGLNNNGAAYVFAQALGGTDNWGQRTKLGASDAQDGDHFGWSVAIDGTEAIVGARYDDDLGADGGSAYFFSQDEGGSHFWGEVGKVKASDGATNDNFGTSVGISGGNSVVGAFRDDTGVQTDRGSAYFFANGCGSNFNGNNVDRTGEQSTLLSGASSVRLFPNPTSDLLNIDVVLETESEVTITVTDAAGRIVSQVFSGVAAPEARYSWDASTVPSGLYFVRVDGGSLRKVVPVSVVR